MASELLTRRVSDSFSANQDVDARIDQDGFSCPTQVHIAAALRVVDYLWTTQNHELRYGLDTGVATFYGTCDAAHNATADCKGITGWSFSLAGAAVAWKSRTQDLVSLSSCESELIAVDEARPLSNMAPANTKDPQAYVWRTRT